MKKKKANRQKAVATVNQPAGTATAKKHPLPEQKNYRELIIILALTFIAYIPALQAGIVNWDDPDYVNKNFLTSGIANLLTTPLQGNYHPLTMLSLAFNYMISGEEPWSYHLLNLLLHLANTYLVFRLVMQLSNRKLVIASVTALLFGIHPMHVESVAWISERKDVLYGLFFIAGLISYTRFVDTNSRKQYLLTLLFLALAILSKPAAVIFPLVLFSIDFFRRRELSFKLVWEKIPFFILPLIFGVLTFLAQKEKGALDTEVFTAGTRFFMGFYGIMMYVVKLILPFRLSPFYPYPAINQPLPPEYYIGPFFFILLVVVAVYSWKRERVAAFGILFYITNLLLVLQFLPVGSAVIADRYTYIPYIGLFFIVGWLINRYAKDQMGKASYIVIPLALLLTILTFRQASVWTDGASLWDHAISVNPNSRAYDNRAQIYNEEKNFPKALEYYSEAIKLNTVDNEAYTNRGNIYFNSGKMDLAFQDYRMALSIKPDYYAALDNLGALYATRGQYDSALVYLNRALQVKKDYFSAYRNRGLTFMEMGRYEEAIKDFESFLSYSPGDADMYNAIGVCHRLGGKFQQALAAINKAIEIRQDPRFILNRSYTYSGLNNPQQARTDALTAKQNGVQLDPAYAAQLGIK